MNNDELEISASLELDVEPLQRSLTEAEQLLQQGLQRMGAIGSGNPTTVQSSPDGSAPQIPVPAEPPTPPPASSAIGLEAAREELERIRRYSESSPDVALAALQGQGGLANRVLKMGVNDHGNEEAYQELVNALKDLTGEVRKSVSGGGGGPDGTGGENPVSSLLTTIRRSAMIGTIGSIAQNTMQGNLFTAGGQGVGAGIGMLLGGPAGAIAGAALGGMVGGAGDSLVGATGEVRKFRESTTDTAARFGDFGQLQDGLSFDSISQMNRSGYSMQDTVGLIDSLRERRVIDGTVDEADKELVQSLQALTRATGLNTDALVQSYSTYRNLGGENNPNQYMAQVVAGAIDVGMKSNLQQYQELMGSASQQLAYSSVSQVDDRGMLAVQGAIKGLMGGDSSTAALLRDNRGLSQSMMSAFLDKGSAQAYSYQDIAMRNIGIDAAKTDTAFVTPEQKVLNAATQYGAIAQKVFGDVDQEQLKANLAQDPDYLTKWMQSDTALQDRVRTQFQAQFGRLPGADDRAIFGELAANQIKNNGTIDLSMAGSTGDPLSKMLGESAKTEAQKDRDAAASRHDAQMEVMNNFVDLQRSIDQTMTEILKQVNDMVQIAKELYSLIQPIIQPILDLVKHLSPEQATPVTASDPQVVVPQQETTLRGDNNTIFKEDPDRRNPFSKIGLPGVGSINPTGGDVGSFGGILRTPSEMINDLPKGMSNPFEQIKLQPLPDAKFNDTPAGGVVATPDYKLFEFAPGDRVTAEMGGGPTDKSSVQLTVSQSFTIGAGADAQALMDAAKKGIETAADSFWENWEQRRRDGGRSWRNMGTNYG